MYTHTHTFSVMYVHYYYTHIIIVCYYITHYYCVIHYYCVCVCKAHTHTYIDKSIYVWILWPRILWNVNIIIIFIMCILIFFLIPYLTSNDKNFNEQFLVSSKFNFSYYQKITKHISCTIPFRIWKNSHQIFRQNVWRRNFSIRI